MVTINLIKTALIMVIILGITSCATAFGDSQRTIDVTTYPSGAKVYLNGILVDRSPTTVTIENPMDRNVLAFQKPGYEMISVEVPTEYQKVGALNVIFPPAFVVDSAMGNMKKITQKKIAVTLSKIQKNKVKA